MNRRHATFAGWPLVVLTAALVSACVPMRVRSYSGPDASIGVYHSYQWAVGDLGSTGDPRLDSNRFFLERVQQAADAELRRRGYEKATTGTPDLVLHVHARVKQQIDTSELDRSSARRCEREECRAHVFDEGTLLIDFVDARTDALVWRGWAERSLDGVVDDQAWMNEVIDKAVAAIFGRLPASSL
jgi:hypothetical protein